MLEIEQELPVEFHKRIRKSFPEFTVRSVVELAFGEVRSGGSPSQVVRPHYDFLDETKNKRITLTGDFIAVTFSKYDSWQEFCAAIDVLLTASREVYEIPYFVKVGLRYRDIIDRAALGLEAEPWSALLRPEVLGLGGSKIFAGDELSELSCHYSAAMKTGVVFINTGFVKRVDGTNQGFLIDADFVSDERMEVSVNVFDQILNEYNVQAGNFFRWCITDRLRDALQPE